METSFTKEQVKLLSRSAQPLEIICDILRIIENQQAFKDLCHAIYHVTGYHRANSINARADVPVRSPNGENFTSDFWKLVDYFLGDDKNGLKAGSKIRQILSWPGEADCEKCGNGDIVQGNTILYCAECDIGFHQQCYSINLVPEGHWYCDDCTVVREADEKGGTRSNRGVIKKKPTPRKKTPRKYSFKPELDNDDLDKADNSGFDEDPIPPRSGRRTRLQRAEQRNSLKRKRPNPSKITSSKKPPGTPTAIQKRQTSSPINNANGFRVPQHPYQRSGSPMVVERGNAVLMTSLNNRTKLRRQIQLDQVKNVQGLFSLCAERWGVEQIHSIYLAETNGEFFEIVKDNDGDFEVFLRKVREMGGGWDGDISAASIKLELLEPGHGLVE